MKAIVMISMVATVVVQLTGLRWIRRRQWLLQLAVIPIPVTATIRRCWDILILRGTWVMQPWISYWLRTRVDAYVASAYGARDCPYA